MIDNTGFLSQAVLASMDDRPNSTREYFSLSLVSPCPMKTKYNIDRFKEANKNPSAHKPAPKSRLLMEDGEFQEQSVLYWLRHAGFTILYTGKQQMVVHTGRLFIPGHPDGILVLNSGLRGLEIKGMNFSRFANAKSSGLEKHQSIRCQVQSYMDSWEWRELGIDSIQTYFKHKEDSNPHDIEIKYEPDWIHPIIETTSRILEGSFIPSPLEIDMCEGCRDSNLCWGEKEATVDLSDIEEDSMPDVEEKYEKGKYYETLGKFMKDEAREVFSKRLGDSKELLLDNHRVSRITYPKSNFDEGKFIKLFGAENLPKVKTSKPVSQMRVYRINEEE